MHSHLRMKSEQLYSVLWENLDDATDTQHVRHIETNIQHTDSDIQLAFSYTAHIQTFKYSYSYMDRHTRNLMKYDHCLSLVWQTDGLGNHFR